MTLAPTRSIVYSVRDARHSTWVVRGASRPVAAKPRLLDRVRDALRTRHYSRRTEEAYVAWVRRYIFFHSTRHPAELSAPEVTRFLASLAVEGGVAASTQNQALSALLFLYREVLDVDLPWLDDIQRRQAVEQREGDSGTVAMNEASNTPLERTAARMRSLAAAHGSIRPRRAGGMLLEATPYGKSSRQRSTR